MTLDFSKCKTPEDVEKVLAANKPTLEMLRKLAALLGGRVR